MNIQWYPGHMTKTKRLIKENLSLVDVVIEILDARVPISSRNPDIDGIIANKVKLMIFNKADLSDPTVNNMWETHLIKYGIHPIFINSITGEGINKTIRNLEILMEEKMQRLRQRSRKHRPIRCMIVGIPNVGKSTFINKIAGKSSAKTGNKPGVTRGKQWIRINDKVELLDTPGILWPKFQDPEVGMKLAWIGSIRDEILDKEELALKLLVFLMEFYPNLIAKRYGLDIVNKEPLEVYIAIAEKRGFVIKGGEIDYKRTADTLLDEFRKGMIGNISLERP